MADQETVRTTDSTVGPGVLRDAEPVDLSKPSSALPNGPMAVLAASLAATSGVIHLAMVPVHASSSLTEALLFAGAGWVQLGLATWLLVRPSTPVLRAGVVAMIVFIGAWSLSRTVGLPYGGHAGNAESVGFIDATTVGLEAAFVLAASAWAWRPTLGAGGGSSVRPIAFGASLAALVIATGAIASPGAADHGQAGHHDDTAAAAGHPHGEDAAPGSPAGGHADGHTDGHGAATPVDDKGFSLLSNGHAHAEPPKPLDPATQAEVDRQLALTQQLVRAYPTVAQAEAAGWLRSGPFAPGLGTHFTGPEMRLAGAAPITDEQILHPILIYKNHEKDAPLVGFMYLAAGVTEPPAGFAGDHDVWHWHDNVCTKARPDGSIDTPFGADAKVTKDLCDKVGGKWVGNTGHMVHAWTVPGWENADGPFAELNPKLTCKDGSFYMIPIEQMGTNTTACKDEAIPQNL